jgi:hypothetical protein
VGFKDCQRDLPMSLQKRWLTCFVTDDVDIVLGAQMLLIWDFVDFG